ncbi:Aste57867_5041 [Aphanomyces stellatus]|uniref:Aste57867_5041 protein n=1 Tax=Aphanomyces stellatus TaxID=120398 RepID=A0A485KH68_9STRA|nr:hypothetical protein As57867_005028 [Aphanomyces stellatus]VFT82122.1 Aste57867_5041 [Aphanomyces stellatus]
MGDVADILGVSGGAATTPPSAKAKKEEKGKPKSKLHREVLLLQENKHAAGLAFGMGGRSHVPVMPGNQFPMKKSLLQQRPALRNKWVRRDFMNAARTDGLVLTHWVKSSLPEGLEYPFARFNVSCDVSPCCTKEEYEKDLLTHKDPHIPTPWTFDDTVYLWDLCKRYELRWVVVADRFNGHVPSKHHRSMEDIKYWYYEVTRLLTDRRTAVAPKDEPSTPKVEVGTPGVAQTAETTPTPLATISNPGDTATGDRDVKMEPTEPVAAAADVTPSTPAAAPSQAAASVAPAPTAYRFHIAYEKQRKAQLEMQFNRSNAEETAIKKLQEELRAVEAQLKKAVLRVDQKKKKARQYTSLVSCPRVGIGGSAASNHTGGHAERGLLSQHVAGAAVAKAGLELEFDQEDDAHAGRGATTRLFCQTDAISLLSMQFGLPTRPMPTKQVCEQFDKVRQDILALLALRKALASKVNDIHGMANKLTQLTGVPHVPRAQHRPVDNPSTGATAASTAIDAATPAPAAASSAPGSATSTPGPASAASSKISQKGGTTIKRKMGAGSGAAAAAGVGKRPKKVA